MASELPAGARPFYAVPALEKALDIIELLAGQAAGLSGSQIAGELDRSSGEIFRILQVLERRRVIERRQPGDRFGLTVKLLELGLAHPPVDQLLTSAIPVMQEMAAGMHQSCHLAVRNMAHILIVAQVPSPGPVGFNVRRGARFPLTESVSGRVLLSFRNPVEFRLWMKEVEKETELPQAPAGLTDTLERIRARGHEIAPSPVSPGVTDVGAPVIDDSGAAVAALTVPYFATAQTRIALTEVPGVVRQAAQAISDSLGGTRRSGV
ncbi:MAG TPA: IclR family transcriptional regulator [Acetobacteraceae bacterium]